ncbi:Lon protease 1 [Komagataeibacter europaeus]|uniref:Lon protease 1 n=1 Tax=Komagataeibacter europaeus TaxID=33995 RepID=A0A0M0ELB7_KOMEU|nr:AAA family ATPase [Komagataeibacter europaeus]KON66018.1 Lon protease 1 [Komagataeibacter europaeus]
MPESDDFDFLIALESGAYDEEEPPPLSEAKHYQSDPHTYISVLPEHYQFPEHKRKSQSDPYESVRRLAHPLKLHEPENIRACIQEVEQACPHALAAVQAMAETDLKWLEWGTSGIARPVLLVGPPGCGKSTVARMYYHTLGYEVMTMNVGAMGDPLSLTGTHQTFGDAKPSTIVEYLATTGMANPCIILDEVDKAPTDGRFGSVQNALLQFLDMRECRQFRDAFLNVPVDVSRVRWVLTANDLSTVSEPLKSRCHIIHMDSPDVTHAPALAMNIIRQIEQDRNLCPGWFTLDGMERRVLAQNFTGDMRALRRMVEIIVDQQVRQWPKC